MNQIESMLFDERMMAAEHQKEIDELKADREEMLALLRSLHWQPMPPGNQGCCCVRCGGVRIGTTEVGGYSSCSLCRLIDRFASAGLEQL
jgi:hypothetical protein